MANFVTNRIKFFGNPQLDDLVLEIKKRIKDSGVIYLTAPEGASALEFEDPITERALRKFQIEDYNNELTWDYTYNIPQVGNYVIFPHWLRHMVLQNESTEPRIAVAFNIG